MRPNRRAADQTGTSTLEIAVVLPVLLLVMFAIVELSRAWLTVNLATTAAREGARVGSVTPTGPGDVFDPAPALARIDAILGAAKLTCASPPCASVTCPTPCVPDSEVRTNVVVTFQTLVPLVLPMLTQATIMQVASMRYE